MLNLDPRVTALGALRLDGSDAGVLFDPTGIDAPTQAERNRAVEQIVRQVLTGVGEHRDGDYAVLDGYDDDGNIVADYGIRNARAFRFLYRKLNWRRAAVPRADDCPACDAPLSSCSRDSVCCEDCNHAACWPPAVEPER